MNIIKSIGKQFGNPQGIMGTFFTFMMNVSNKKLYRAVINELQMNAEETVLDIGFGNGYMLSKIAKSSKCKLYGIDISEDIVKNATKRNKKYIQKNQMVLRKGTVMDIKMKEGFLDEVYTVNTIYFWDDLVEGLKEIRRVLKDDGIFVNGFYTDQFLNKVFYTNYGFKKYTERDFREAALEAGFEIEKVVEIKTNMSYCYCLKKRSATI